MALRGGAVGPDAAVPRAKTATRHLIAPRPRLRYSARPQPSPGGRGTPRKLLKGESCAGCGTLAAVLAQPGVTAYRHTGTAARPTTVTVGGSGRYVRIQLVTSTPTALNLAEVRALR
ncbi:hypothetical protein GCM10028775_23980 [Catellatospora paridis]